MDKETSAVTRILFIDADELSFEFRKCMIGVLKQLPPLELFHAKDATEALQIIDQLELDAIVLDHEDPLECDLFLESLTANHPPVIYQSDDHKQCHIRDTKITVVPKDESLAGIHETLQFVTTIATKGFSSETNFPH